MKRVIIQLTILEQYIQCVLSIWITMRINALFPYAEGQHNNSPILNELAQHFICFSLFATFLSIRNYINLEVNLEVVECYH